MKIDGSSGMVKTVGTGSLPADKTLDAKTKSQEGGPLSPRQGRTENSSGAGAAASDTYEKAQEQGGLKKLFDVFRPGADKTATRSIVEPEDRTAGPAGIIEPADRVASSVPGPSMTAASDARGKVRETSGSGSGDVRAVIEPHDRTASPKGIIQPQDRTAGAKGVMGPNN